MSGPVVAVRARREAIAVLRAMYQDAAALDVLELDTERAIDRLVAAKLPERDFSRAAHRMLEGFIASCFQRPRCGCPVTLAQAIDHHRRQLEQELDVLACERIAKRCGL